MIQNALPGLESYAPADPELEHIANRLRCLDPDGSRTAHALRRSIDMLLDGKNTGRYRWDQLHKTEKTHCGTLVEINLQREFGFADGVVLDYAIDGIDIDCKYSQQVGDWMIPPEAIGRLLFGVWASDDEGRWCAGIVRAHKQHLTGPNRDQKRRLTAPGKAAVVWLHRGQLPENVLLRLPPPDVEAIFHCSRHGSRRLDELFRRAQRRIISRNVVATVAQQEDYMKRVRGNGGSRSALRPEGIVILGQYGSHQEIARRLELPVPGPGDSVSVRLSRRASHHESAPTVALNDEEWVVALPADPPEPAPLLPGTGRPG